MGGRLEVQQGGALSILFSKLLGPHLAPPVPPCSGSACFASLAVSKSGLQRTED